MTILPVPSKMFYEESLRIVIDNAGMEKLFRLV